MRNTFRILFYIKRSAMRRDGRAPVMVRITVNGERTQLTTRHAVAPAKWDALQGRMAGRSAEARLTNGSLELIRARIGGCYDRLTASGEPATPARIKDMYLGGDGRRQMLLAFFRDHNEEFAQMVGVSRSANTLYKYRCVYTHLARFVCERYGSDDVPFYRLDSSFVTAFHSYIMRTGALKPNTAWVYMTALKHILMLARGRGCLSRDIFLNYRMRSVYVPRGYLTTDEIRRVAQLPLPEGGMRLVRDLFLFSCFTGLSYIDIRNMRFDNIRTLDGELWIDISRRKTGTSVSVRLFDVPQLILARYSSAARSGTVFAVPSNGWCNSCLRRIMLTAGIERRITFHSARHTFATSITLSQGVAIESISKLLGHKNIRTTQIYAEVTRSRLRNEMNLLSKRLEKMDCAPSATA
ncbi:MAG: site-specific integrase [Alistipes sp.]|nr:site-specific integrase [Alistipes sp.]